MDQYQKVNDSVNTSKSSDHHHDSNLLEHCENDDRLGFVRKVYGILATQLTLTFGFVAAVKATPTLDYSM